MQHEKRVVLYRVLAMSIGFALSFALAELGLALWSPIETKRVLINELEPRLAYHLYSSNPFGEFEPAPSPPTGPGWHLLDFSIPPTEFPLARLRETPWSVTVQMSVQGLRDRVYDPKPSPGVVRIAGVGDSFVMGEGVPLESSLMKQVEGLLGDGYEVVNAGMHGYSTSDEARRLRSVAERLHCERGIVVYLLNDIDLTKPLGDRQDFINDLINVRYAHLGRRDEIVWYAGHSRLLHLLGSSFEMRRVERQTIQWYRDMYDERHNAANLQKLKGDIRDIASAIPAGVVFVLYPLMEGLEGEYLFRDVHGRVAEMAREAGMPVLDLAPFFEGRKTSALQVHPADHHPNGKAHRIAAEAIVGWLRDEVPDFLTLDTNSEQAGSATLR